MKTAATTALMLVLSIGCGEAHETDDGGAETALVGLACLPESMPVGGFNGLEVYLETSSASCETRACMVYRLDGDPRMLDCDGPGCVSRAEAEARVFCTCRCAADDPASPLCACPSGFECVEDVITTAGAGVNGGYCVREGL